MATIINNPDSSGGSNSGVGIIVGIIALIVVVGLFFVYVLPAIRSSGAAAPSGIDINVKLPTGSNPTAPTPSTP